MMQLASSNKGSITNGIRLSGKGVTFNFKMVKPQVISAGSVVGIDIGLKSVYSTSNGQQSQCDVHGWDLDKIQDKLTRRKKGSNGFRRAQTHRKNHINSVLNKMDWAGIKKIRIEKIKQMRYKSRTSRKLSHWTYTLIFDKLGSLAEEHGVHVQEDNPAFTSRRCSQCGWVKRANRKGKRLCCGKCGYTADADMNAAVNISLDLPEVTKEDRQSYYNRDGFYWNVAGHEPIVRVA
jgi:IS605 OrfB family transposase